MELLDEIEKTLGLRHVPITWPIGMGERFRGVYHLLRSEYRVECQYEPVQVYTARWIECDDPKKLEEFKRRCYEYLAEGGVGHLVYLAPSRVNLELAEERWPEIQFKKTREIW